MKALSREERQHKQLLNEADRDYPRTLALLKIVLAKVNSTTPLRMSAERSRLARELKEQIAELMILACEEQDAVTARELKQAIGVVARMTEKVAASMADAIGSQAMKDLFAKGTGTSSSIPGGAVSEIIHRELVSERWEIWWKYLPKATHALTSFDTRKEALLFYNPEKHRLVYVRRYKVGTK